MTMTQMNVNKEEEQKQPYIDKDGLLQLQMSAETRKMVLFIKAWNSYYLLILSTTWQGLLT